MCIYNQMIKNRKYVKNKTNKGNVPTLPDRRIEYVPTKCGNCIECRKQYAREWQVRLLEHIKTKTNGKFITFTFSDESIYKITKEQISRTNKQTGKIEQVTIQDLQGYTKDNAIATRAVHNFRNRWRKKYNGESPEHWLITELGHNGTENIHLHGIIWTDKTYDEIRERWGYGYIWPRPETTQKTYVSERTINYMIKYISKIDQRNKEYKQKVLTSPGIGKKYIESYNAKQHQYNDKKNNVTYYTTTGHKIALPTYYRKKLYTEEELERIWLAKLDEETRYVLGNKIDISKGEQEYNEAVKYARELNKELGYGQRPNENRKEYEEQRRELMMMTRIKKANQNGPSNNHL